MTDNNVNLILGARDQATKVVKGLRGQMEQFKRDAMQGFGIGAGFNAFNLFQRGLTSVIDIAGDAINAASDLSESQAKVDQVFTDSADTIRRWAQGAARDFGLSEQAALEAAGTFGNFIQALGNTEAEANDMSRTLVELAADLASFNNQEIGDVLVALQSGLAGEAEPMRRLGVSISATRVENQLLAKGLVRTKAEITDAMKVAERYAIIMEDTAKAQGDFDRTSDGLANTQRTLNAQLADASAELGERLLPFALQVTKALSEGVVPAFSDAMDLIDEFFEAMSVVNEQTRELVEWKRLWRTATEGIDTTTEAVQALKDEYEAAISGSLTDQKALEALIDSYAISLPAAIATTIMMEQRNAQWRKTAQGLARRYRLEPEDLIAPDTVPKVEETTKRIVDVFTDLPKSLRDTIKDGRQDVREAMADLRWAAERPFADQDFARFLKRSGRAATEALEQGIREGRPGLVNEAYLTRIAVWEQLELIDPGAGLQAGMRARRREMMNPTRGPSDAGDVPHRRRGRRGKGTGQHGATLWPGDYGYAGEAAMERVYNDGGVTRIEPLSGGRRRAGGSRAIHTHVYLDGRQIAESVDRALDDMYVGAGSGDYARAS